MVRGFDLRVVFRVFVFVLLVCMIYCSKVN